MALLYSFLYQLLFTVGVIVLFGLLISLIRRAFLALMGESGNVALLIMGIVGTPVHEFSHALACLIFGHKIKDVKLYDPKLRDGSLGYVKHTYNHKNLYHQIGNFFISTAPIVVGALIIYHLMMFMTPQVYGNARVELSSLAGLADGGFEMGEIVDCLWCILRLFLAILDFSNVNNVRWWAFIVISLMILSHMELSASDIKLGFKGFLFLAGMLLAVDTVLFFFFKDSLSSVTSFAVTIGVTLASFMTLSLSFCLLLLLLSLIVRGIMMLFGR